MLECYQTILLISVFLTQWFSSPPYQSNLLQYYSLPLSLSILFSLTFCIYVDYILNWIIIRFLFLLFIIFSCWFDLQWSCLLFIILDCWFYFMLHYTKSTVFCHIAMSNNEIHTFHRWTFVTNGEGSDSYVWSISMKCHKYKKYCWLLHLSAIHELIWNI